MAVHKLTRKQWIPADIEQLWDFFSHPRNLATITPPYMKFRITSEESGEGLYAGQIITYKVSPVLNIPLFWMTEITHVNRHIMFVDEQVRGPYKQWHHEHWFKKQGDGTLMTDIVHYELPFYFLGDAVHSLFVKRQLNEIFDYREQKIKVLFKHM